jgi:hypothetical protein
MHNYRAIALWMVLLAWDIHRAPDTSFFKSTIPRGWQGRRLKLSKLFQLWGQDVSLHSLKLFPPPYLWLFYDIFDNFLAASVTFDDIL